MGKFRSCDCGANFENGSERFLNYFPPLYILIEHWDGDDHHVANAYHVNHHFPKGLLLLPRKVDEDITFWILKQLEGHGQVMVLQHRLVIVHQGQLRACGVGFSLGSDGGVKAYLC